MSDEVNLPDDGNNIEDELTAEVIDEAELTDSSDEHEVAETEAPDIHGAALHSIEKPEWKRKAEEIFEERQAQKAEMRATRQQREAERKAKKSEYEAERQEKRKQAETQFKSNWEKQQEEKKIAIDNLMQHVREERERKQREHEEREAKLRQEQGRLLRYPKPFVISNHNAQANKPETKESGSKGSKEKPLLEEKDLASRLSRLSKKEDDG
jgi:hypothetical protein